MASNKKQVVEFNYDISCPFAYIASTRIEALAARQNTLLIWTPVLLGAIYRQTAAPQGAAGSASDVFNASKKVVTSRAFVRTMSRYQIPFNQPAKHPQKTTSALRLLHSVSNDGRAALSKALFKAYWVENKDVSDQGVLFEIARQSGIASLSGISEADISNDSLRKALEAATANSVDRGAPGVPSFWLPAEKWTDAKGRSREGRLYWGQDRMHFVEAVLITLNKGMKYDQVPALGELQPRCLRDTSLHAQKPETKLEFWYDFSSPWAFLGWTQLERMKREAGSSLTIELKPILLGALFREIGSPMMPMLAVSPQKRAYGGLDQADWVRHWNALNIQQGSHDKPIELRWPDVFPIRSPTLLRIAIVEPKTIPVMYRACWEQKIDVSNAKILASFLSAAGFDSEALLKKAGEQAIKDQLRVNTEEALKLGLCGVPTYRVLRKSGSGDWAPVGGIVWGQDELGVVEDLIAGWREEGGGPVADVGEGHRGRKPRL